MKKKLNARGFHLVMIPLIVILIGAIGFTGWYVYNANKKTDVVLDNSTKTTNPTKTTPTPSVSASPTPTPADSTTYLTITEWGVKGVQPADLTIKYGVAADDGNRISLSSEQLIVKVSPYCGFRSDGKAAYTDSTPPGGFGVWAGVYRTTNGQEEIIPGSTTLVKDVGKLINGYYYVYVSPQSTCVPESLIQEPLIGQTISGARAFYNSLIAE